MGSGLLSPKCQRWATKDEPVLSIFRGRVEKLVFPMDFPSVFRPLKRLKLQRSRVATRLSRSLSLFKFMVLFDRHL